MAVVIVQDYHNGTEDIEVNAGVGPISPASVLGLPIELHTVGSTDT